MEKYLDKSLSAQLRATDLLSKMSISEKMGQIVCLFPQTSTDYAVKLKDYPQGAGHVSALEMRMLKNIEQAVEMQRTIQEAIMCLTEHKIPAIFHMEGLSGLFLKDSVSFPSGIARGSSWNSTLEYEIGKMVGQHAAAAGISQVLAPILDVSFDPRMGRYGEPYSEDATLVAALGCAYTKGLQENNNKHINTQAVAKHFLGFHRSIAGIHGVECEISQSKLREVYAKPFQAAITESGLRGVMPCYNTLNGKPVSSNSCIMNSLLRDEMGFNGLTISDYCAIINLHLVQKVASSFTASGAAAIAAGLDVELQFKKCYNDELKEWFESGKLEIAILDRAVRRVLEAKFAMGLFEQPFAMQATEVKKIFNMPQNKQLSLQSALQSMVLIKNNGILPMDSNTKKIAVIGYHASTARSYFSGYTHFSMAEGLLSAMTTMAGLEAGNTQQAQCYDGSNVVKEDYLSESFEQLLLQMYPDIKPLKEELKSRFSSADIKYAYGYHYAGNDCSFHNQALESAKDADIIIMTVGGKYGTGAMNTTSEGVDSTNINIPIAQELLIEKMSKLNKPIILIHLDGRPISSDAADKYASAILQAWSPAQFGSRAIIDVLTGEYNPGGKLPVTVAYNSGQIPIFYNHFNGSSYNQGESIGLSSYVDITHKPRYYFGHGLSYTQFEYSNLHVNKKFVSANEIVEISFEIENIGEVDGDEVVQFYIKDCYADMVRPVMELVGFKRVALKAKQKRTITFLLDPSQTAYFNHSGKWIIEAGEIEVLIGGASNKIKLKDSINIKESKLIDGKTRKFYSDTK